jgi:primosomal protein N' (replication factor Y) (superfamily II helicase)
MRLSDWLASYYHAPPAAVWQTILPTGVNKKRRAKTLASHSVKRTQEKFRLTTEQQKVINYIRNTAQTTTVLQGITGSGKTAVYRELAQDAVEQNKSAMIILPEIALTAQLIGEFAPHFAHIILTHSRMTEAERHMAWQSALESTVPVVVIGPRSALFLPLKNIGFIAIDEAHEPSLKQEQAPRYHANRAATLLAKEHRAKLVLGSATPLVSDRYLAENNNALVRMDHSAQKTGTIDIKVVDSRQKPNFSTHRFLSNTLLDAIDKTLSDGQQTLIFHNRRGSAPITLCEQCGWQAMCKNCHTPQVLHADTHTLLCHICGQKDLVPLQCPACRHADIIHKGIGTKLIFDTLQKRYPNKKIVRFDQDTSVDEALDKQYQAIYDGEIDIIIGTQIVAKGLDLPKLATVGVIQADSGLSLPDFSTSERVFQLLYQVMGRVGRRNHESRIVVQTYQPEHPAITTAIARDYDSFYKQVIDERAKLHFPPFSHLLRLTCSYNSEAYAAQAAIELKKKLKKYSEGNVLFLGPTPAFRERKGNSYRWQLVLRSPQRSSLVALLDHLPPAHWQYELDPLSLLS